MSNHHNHPSHVYNFINKHTAFAILLLIIGCFMAGYFAGAENIWNDRHHDRDGRYMMREYSDSIYR